MDARERASADTTVREWLERLAQASGAPGGGAASAVQLAMGAALLQMVAGYTDDDEIQALSEGLAERRERLLAAGTSDAEASATLGAALALDPDDESREARVVETARRAAESVASIGLLGETLLDALRVLDERGNPNVRADLEVAAAALAAGMTGVSITLRAGIELLVAHGDSGSAQDAGEVVRSLEDQDARIRATGEQMRAVLN